MSAKGNRSRAWDDRHLTGALTPVKWLVRALSSIPLAVCTLTLVSLYGVLASIPVGLLALIPTWAFKGLTLVVSVALLAWLPMWFIGVRLRKASVSRGVRFSALLLGGLVLTVCVSWGWSRTLYPAMLFDPYTGRGVQFFSDFVQNYSAIQARRLPGMEMSELEFYSWWPLSALLLLFVVNMIVATLRRIEFSVPNLGVLTVHTGIVSIALGSVLYATHKQEGDMLLLAGDGLDQDDHPLVGRPETGFYDNTRTALWVTQKKSLGWEQRPLEAVPRYNDYGLNVVPGGDPEVKTLGPLDLPAPAGIRRAGEPIACDPELGFRIVGYASFAEPTQAWVRASQTSDVIPPGLTLGASGARKLRVLESVIDPSLAAQGKIETKYWRLAPESPAERWELLDLLGVEYLINASESRWRALSEPIPQTAQHALLVEIPSTGFRQVYAIQPELSINVGNSGYVLTIKELAPEPQFPIVTTGYRGATSSVCIVRVQPPTGAEGAAAEGDGKPFDRWLYHRFPEIAQDLSVESGAGDAGGGGGMPARRSPDGRIVLTYLDTSVLQVYFDERPDGSVRSIVRLPGGNATISSGLKVGEVVQVAPKLGIKLAERLDDAVSVEVPRVVPEEQRDRQQIGNHQAAMVAVEITDRSSTGSGGGAKIVRWVPFSKYLNLDGPTERTFVLPHKVGEQEKSVTVAFGRVRHEFWPPMALRLKSFEMIPYPHSTTPRDYRSDVVVSTRWPSDGGGEGDIEARDEVRRTSLNEPLLVRTPYVAPEGIPAIGAAVGRLIALVSPNQYKFAQAGWDQAGWRQSQAAVEAGQLKRPHARFTILGVGNNPGIYVIATGAVMMSVGIPWAFYIKPIIMRRRKLAIQKQLGEAGRSAPLNRNRERASRQTAEARVES